MYFVYKRAAFLKMLIDALESCGLLVDYCDYFFLAAPNLFQWKTKHVYILDLRLHVYLFI